MTIDPSAPGARAHLGNLADVAATLRPTGASSYNDNITANTLRQQQANRDSRTYGTFEGEHKLRQAAAPVDPGCVLRFEPDSFNGTIMSFTRRLEVAMDALRKGKGGLVPGKGLSRRGRRAACVRCRRWPACWLLSLGLFESGAADHCQEVHGSAERGHTLRCNADAARQARSRPRLRAPAAARRAPEGGRVLRPAVQQLRRGV